MSSRSILGIVTATLLLATLTGCGSSPPITPTTGTPTASPAAPGSTSPTAPPKTSLFTISAKVRDKTGNTIAIEMLAHPPLAHSDKAAKPMVSEFVRACAASSGSVPLTAETLTAGGSILMPLELSASTSGKAFDAPISVTLGNFYFGQFLTGSGITPGDATRPCNSGFTWTTSGNGRAIADFENGTTTPDLSSWKYALYGFSVPPDSQSSIEACTVTLSEGARATVAGIAGWDLTQAATGFGCTIGYVGE